MLKLGVSANNVSDAGTAEETGRNQSTDCNARAKLTTIMKTVQPGHAPLLSA